jgi:hypothetical protein
MNGFSVAATFKGEFSDVTHRQGYCPLRLVVVDFPCSHISPFRGDDFSSTAETPSDFLFGSVP